MLIRDGCTDQYNLNAIMHCCLAVAMPDAALNLAHVHYSTVAAQVIGLTSCCCSYQPCRSLLLRGYNQQRSERTLLCR